MAVVEVVKYLEGPNGVTNKIKQAMYNVAREFVYIGFLLWECQQYGYYREHGFENIYDYAAFELDMKRTTVKNLIAINEAFGTCNRKMLGNGRTVSERTMSLQAPYEKFKYSQLTEMLSMSAMQRAKVTPDMTVKQIREIKKADKEPEIDFKSLDNLIVLGQTSDQQQAVIINNIWHDLPPELVKQVVKAAGITYRVNSCYDIVVKLHPKNSGC